MKNYSAIAVANFFIGRSLLDKVPRTNLALQKLVFFTHAAFFKVRGEALVSDPVIAWPYGPVFVDLYRELSSYGSRPVSEKIKVPILAPGGEVSVIVPEVSDRDTDTCGFLLDAWESMGRFSVGKLVSASHSPGGAWFETVAKFVDDPNDMEKVFSELPRNVTILDEVIKRCGR